MKKTLTSLAVSAMLLISLSCSKDNGSPSKQEDQPNPGSPTSELTVLATADITLDENKNQIAFIGYQKKGVYLNPSGKVGGLILDNKILDLHFQDEDKNTIALKINADQDIEVGTYDIQNAPEFIQFVFEYKKSIYHILKAFENIGKYHGEAIKPTGQLMIDQITDTHIKGSFYFDLYNKDYSKKIEVKNGKFESEILRE